jgi:hypothetical protein
MGWRWLRFNQGSEGSCLEITPKSTWLSGHAPGIDESIAEQQTAERHAAWGKRLPREPEALWAFIHGLSDDERMNLLAHCARHDDERVVDRHPRPIARPRIEMALHGRVRRKLFWKLPPHGAA